LVTISAPQPKPQGSRVRRGVIARTHGWPRRPRSADSRCARRGLRPRDIGTTPLGALQTVFPRRPQHRADVAVWPLRRAVPSAALRPREARPLAESIASSAAMRNRCGMKRWSDAERAASNNDAERNSGVAGSEPRNEGVAGSSPAVGLNRPANRRFPHRRRPGWASSPTSDGTMDEVPASAN
jgi:hypothetical protein